MVTDRHTKPGCFFQPAGIELGDPLEDRLARALVRIAHDRLLRQRSRPCAVVKGWFKL